MKEKPRITVEVNNNRIMALSQEEHDGNIVLTTGGRDKTTDGEWVINPGDFVMLMNYYRTQKEKGEPIL